jgi:hypothetical protein
MLENKKIWIVLVALAAGARLAPHPWHFTPMIALGLFAGTKAAKVQTGLIAALAALLLSDAILGFYSGMWYVYAATLVPVFAGRWIRPRQSVSAVTAAALGSSLSFFILTNFPSWASGRTYTHDLAGLAACYAAAIPFFQNQILGDAFYTALLFGGYALFQRLRTPTPQTA